MFSLIVTITSIVLVALLVAATLYFGGTAFNQGSAQAKSDALVLQGQQISGASDLYMSDFGVWPANLDALVAAGYLSKVPAGVASAEPDLSMMMSAFAAGKGWITPTNGVPTYRVETPVTDEICKKVNYATLGSDGILAQAYARLDTQCYRSKTDLVNYVVITRDGKNLAAALPSLDVAAATQLAPAFGDTTGAWSTVPTKTSIAPPLGFSKSSDTIKVTSSGTYFQSLPNVIGTSITFTVTSLSGSPITVNTGNPNIGNFTPNAFYTSDPCGTAARITCSVTISFQGVATPGSVTNTFTFTPSLGGLVTIDLTALVKPDIPGWYMPDYSAQPFYTKVGACNSLVTYYPAHFDYYQPNAYYFDAAKNPTMQADGVTCNATQDVHYLLPPDYPYINTTTKSGYVYQESCYFGSTADGRLIDICK